SVADRRRGATGLAGALSRTALAAPLVLGLALAGPGLWGAGGRLDPVTHPAGWARARQIVRAEPGTVLALPWREYPQLSFAAGRTVFNPLPDYLGGDVLSSYDPEFSSRRTQEQVDHRARRIDGLVDGILGGRASSLQLRALGVRWVVLLRESDWTPYTIVLRRDPGLELVLSDPALEVYRVTGWQGPATGATGQYGLRRPIPPYISTSAPAGAVLDVPAAPGWVRGWGRAAGSTADGRLRVPAGSGPLWFWPALLVVGIHVGVLAAAVACALRVRIGRAGRVPTNADKTGVQD
ncbi:MAG: hypothetical protein JWN46_1765, partial [Acidimicrobiales bacterium]|nr:hypothetical protein [Acidimicrobiales bacterium]